MNTIDVRCIHATPDVAFAPQPTVEELNELPKAFASVLNLRSREEDGYVDESDACRNLGLPYVNIEWKDANDIDDDKAAKILAEIDALPKPLFVHCLVGFTAAWAVLVKVCRDNNLSTLECLKYGYNAGFDFTAFPNMYAVLHRILR
jgi:protein tyrosine phosphatase (PTP) superfamily phosphohydrolase (DUF442 family)